MVNEPQPLSAPVYLGGAYRPFGELTLAEVKLRAAELHAAGGFGPTARVVPVARAWAELARVMETRRASVVAEIGADEAAEFARRTWALPPRLL